MKYFPSWIAFLSCMAQGETMMVGGWVHPVHHVECVGNSEVNFSEDGENVLVATCHVTDNRPEFQATFQFGLEAMQTRSIEFTSLTFHGSRILLGQGLEPPNGLNILAEMRDGIFSWEPGQQRTTTIDYPVEFRASWKVVSHQKMPEDFLHAGLRITTITRASD